MRPGFAAAVLLTVGVAACENTLPSEMEPPSESPRLSAALDVSGSGMLDAVNAALSANGAEYMVASAEYFTDPSEGATGNIIYARDVGNRRLSTDFVPNDPRRGGNPNALFYVVDGVDGTADVAGEAAAIHSAMATWDAQTCSALGMAGATVPIDIGVVQAILGFGGNPLLFTDVMHSGFLPGLFFDFLAPGGSNFILGVTFTFWFTDGPGGPPTDIDGNGLPDVAFRDIYYNDAFAWADDGTSHIDVETVALHEAGHGLSQGHFGTIFQSRNGKFHFSPRAVMNASYSGVQRAPTGTDNAGHCGNWGDWPNN